MITYCAEVVEKIENPGRWYGIRVAVFRCEGAAKEQVGQYHRNYPSLFRTFCHFRKGDKDYALYSPDYTVSRILELPSCKDIGGEEPDAGGFCPTDFHVPSYVEREYVDVKDKTHRYKVNEPSPEALLPQTVKWTKSDEKTGELTPVERPSYPVGPLMYYPFGFVAGCLWGDDNSWKIQFLDLEKAEAGILKRDERFGYIAMPASINLNHAIDMTCFQLDPKEEWGQHINIAVRKKFNLRTGEALDEVD